MSGPCIHGLYDDSAISVTELADHRVRIRVQEDLILEGEPDKLADFLFSVATVLTHHAYGVALPAVEN